MQFFDYETVMGAGRQMWARLETGVATGCHTGREILSWFMHQESRPRPSPLDPTSRSARPAARGKFLFVGDEKLPVRGATYGPFRPQPDGSEYPAPGVVDRDFARMAVHGINAVRTYTVPPRWLLDAARRRGVRLMIGVPWEQHVAFLDDPGRAASIEARVREAVRQCAGHPAVLCYAIGNEIPSEIVRWHGARAIERFLARLYRAAKGEDPGALVTYVNYPSTEYLDLPFVDLVAFNVYLEAQDRLDAYLARLQNLAGDRPLLLAETGLDSRRHGEAAQAAALDWQVRTAFAGGAAGTFVFSWTDEWHRGGQDVTDWCFGLTTAGRREKPALPAVQAAYADLPLAAAHPWPLVSVVVCSRNGARTIRGCLEGIAELAYPRFEVIVVDDGSTDATADIAGEFDVQLISVANGGLSNARNLGWRAARGEIVAYLDDDARPDPDWLAHLVGGFSAPSVAGVGGPNISPPGDGFMAGCIDHSPGNPTHVLIGDREAEHLPGCNMAFRRDCLEAVGGFDTQFCIAGDDVDLCWRLRDRGWVLGFSPGAMVWHHRRGTARAYWRQQVNYGRAEAMLERKWPERYNAAGHLRWAGRVYAKALAPLAPWGRRRIYQGTWGTALFQSVYQAPGFGWTSVLNMPEWYLFTLAFGIAAVAGAFFPALGPIWIGFVLALLAPVIQAASVAGRILRRAPASRLGFRGGRWCTVAFLHLLQPAARLWGRLSFGLTPWRRRGSGESVFPWKRTVTLWSEIWRSAGDRLEALEERLRKAGAIVMRGGAFDRWDLKVRGGMLGDARLLHATEEHGQGRQQFRVNLRPAPTKGAVVLLAVLLLLTLEAAIAADWSAVAVLGVVFGLAAVRTGYEAGGAVGALLAALKEEPQTQREVPPAAAGPGRAAGTWTITTRLLRQFIPGQRGKIVLGLVLVLGASGMALLRPWPLKLVLDSLLGHVPLPAWLHLVDSRLHAFVGPIVSPGYLLLLELCVGLLLIEILSGAFNVLSTYVLSSVALRMVFRLRCAVFDHLQTLSLRFHIANPVGDSMYRVTWDTYSVQTVFNAFVQSLTAAVTLVGIATVMLTCNLTVALITLLVAVPLTFLIRRFDRPMTEQSMRVHEHESRVSSRVQQALSGIRAVLAFGRESVESAAFREKAGATLGANLRLVVIQTVSQACVGLVLAAGTASVIWVGAENVMSGRLTPGDLVLLITYAAMVFKPLETLAYTAATLQGAAAGGRRVYEILDAVPDVRDARGATALGRVTGNLEFENIWFQYEPGRPVLRDINLSVRSGTSVALVGPSGTGKSTLVNLLMRFYDPGAGRIAVDGRDLRTVTLSSLRQNIALVSQEPILFCATIRENIAYGRPEASFEEIQAAAAAAGIHDFIAGLPQQYETLLAENGATLSCGQRQRLSIARAFLKDAPILILDEPTSALDAETEEALTVAIRDLSRGRTTLIIAHRLSTIRFADEVVVMQDGTVAERGTFAGLLARSGAFARLYHLQYGTALQAVEAV